LNPREIKAVIFDFDGTICDSLKVKAEAFGEVYSKYGKDISSQVIDYHNNNLGVPREIKFKYFQKEIVNESYSIEKINELSDIFSKLVVKKVIEAPFIEGAKEFLSIYHDRYDLYISSATPQKELERIINAKGISKFFMTINGSPEKKDEHIRKIMRSKNFRKEETVFIGDANQDKEAAEITGVHFIGVGMNNFSEDTLKLENLIALNDFIQSRLLS
tara:strand:+ start:248 stop:898 length:651 start_codon:yes stop_codon:yes gene_type:complete